MQTLIADLIRSTRQHHAIEHATLHLLAARRPGESFSGISDPWGFTILGEVDEPTLRKAVGDALLHLHAGERHLAIHPNCGGNLAVAGLIVTLVALLAGGGRRPFWDRYPTALIFVLPALVLARSLGYHVQRYTTLADVADRWVAAIEPVELFGAQAHRVSFV